MNTKEIIEKLKEGNRRFVKGELTHKNSSKSRIQELKSSQKPCVAVLSCSDSRVVPTIIFDLGLGDLFEIRNAGHIIDNSVIGSLEYAVSKLNVSLILVLSHDNCGAIDTAIKYDKTDSTYINSIIDYIKPTITNSDTHTITVDCCKNTANILPQKSKIIYDAITNNKLKIICANYDIETGLVEFLP